MKASYFGPYENIGSVHDAISRYIKVMDLEYAGPPWEIYVTDPMQEPDTAKWETVVCYPIK